MIETDDIVLECNDEDWGPKTVVATDTRATDTRAQIESVLDSYFEQAALITVREVDRAFWRGVSMGVSSALFVLLVTASVALALGVLTVRVVW